jgi:hypothetical protein
LKVEDGKRRTERPQALYKCDNILNVINMKNNFFSNTAPVIPTGASEAKRSGGISRLTHNATIKAGAHVSRFLGKLGMTVLLLSPVVLLSAQPGVTITGLAVETGTVTLDVRWEPLAPPAVWSDTVWVFVDYNDNGTMKRLPLTGATLTNPSAAATATVPLPNNKGAWVAGNARSAGSFSTKVKLYYDSQTAVVGACVYASNYPPVGEYTASNVIAFTGTPNYKIKLKETGSGTISDALSEGLYTIPAGYIVQSFTDKTGAPGIMKCIPMTGGLNFSAPGAVSKGQQASFSVAESPSVPDALAVTYLWSAPDFNPISGTGASFSTAAPAEAGTYPVTLTAQSEGYCDLPVTKDVSVVDCPLAGRLGVGAPCAGNSGGRIGI